MSSAPCTPWWGSTVVRVAEGTLDQLRLPERYAGTWLVVGVALVVVAVLGSLLVLRLTRRSTPAQGPPALPEPPEVRREAALRRLEALEAAYDDGRLDARETAHRTAAVLRDLAGQAAGLDARALTPAELRASGVPGFEAVADAVAACEPVQFRAQPPGVDGLLGTAREAVQAWT